MTKFHTHSDLHKDFCSNGARGEKDIFRRHIFGDRDKERDLYHRKLD